MDSIPAIPTHEVCLLSDDEMKISSPFVLHDCNDDAKWSNLLWFWCSRCDSICHSMIFVCPKTDQESSGIDILPPFSMKNAPFVFTSTQLEFKPHTVKQNQHCHVIQQRPLHSVTGICGATACVCGNAPTWVQTLLAAP